MNRIVLKSTVSGDGVLHLALPVGAEEANREVQVTVEPVPPAPEGLGWPPGYFDKTFGSITDETFQRPPQGELPKPVELD
jgi:hypothetical protein